MPEECKKRRLLTGCSGLCIRSRLMLQWIFKLLHGQGDRDVSVLLVNRSADSG